MTGLAAALLAVAIYAAYPVATRAALGAQVTPETLVFLRYGLGLAFFLPFLAQGVLRLPSAAWREGLRLALLQGLAMGALVVGGLQFAPASHAAALGPGASPAWVAVLGFALYRRRPCPRHAAGATITLAGAGVLIAAGGSIATSMLLGDLMFLAASAMGAAYVLRLRASGLPPLAGAALVALYSAAAAWPWALATGVATATLQMPAAALAWHAAWQALLIGFVALVALNVAVARLGGEATTALFALVPVGTTVLGHAALGETPGPLEAAAVLAISAGVAIAAMPRRSLGIAPVAAR